MSAESIASTPTLDMSDQLALEKLALRIVTMPQVQRQKELAKEMYRNHAVGKTRDGISGIENVVNAIALASVQFAITADTSRPRIMWAFGASHTWSGIEVPSSGFSNGNPDNMYRIAGIDGASRYEITGKRTGRGPIQEVFVLFTAIPGSEEEHVENQEGAPVVAALADKDLTLAPDGSFRITIDGDSATPGIAHLQSKPNTKLLMVRDTLADWTTQFPNRLRLRRIEGPTSSPLTDETLADHAVAILRAEVPFWLKFFDDNNYKRPPNTRETAYGRKGGWGFAMSNSYKLEDDEVLVVTLDSLGAAYLGFQISDPWGITTDYIRRTSGLNSSQAKPNHDGTYTYVIGPKDPKVWNWLDTEGRHMGLWTIRWQNTPDSVTSAADAVQQMAVVKITDLRKTLRAETVWVSASDRERQLSERTTSYALRLAN